MFNNLFVYGLDGKVFFSPIKFSGSWADGVMMTCFQKKTRNYIICIDKGFPKSGLAFNDFVGPLNDQ